MESIVAALEKSLKEQDYDTSCKHLKRLESSSLDDVPIKSLKLMIENGTRQAFVLAMRILASLVARKKEALNTLLGYVEQREKDDIRYLAVSVLADLPTDRLLQIPSEIFYDLLRDPVPTIKNLSLGILKQVAKDAPKKIPWETLDMVILREKNPTFREGILEISKIANPILLKKNQSQMVTIDTLFLINWMKGKMALESTEIQELVSEIQAKYIQGSYEYPLLNSLIAESCVVDAFLFMMPKRYRGHQIHQFNVASLGMFLLKAHVNANDTLVQYISNQNKWTLEEVEKCWLISALLHDHAFPIVFMLENAPIFRDLKEAYPTYTRPINTMLTAFDEAYHNLFSNTLDEIYRELLKGNNTLSLSDLIQHELKRIDCKFQYKKNMNTDHGIIGAVNLTTRLSSKNDDFVDTSEIVKTAARAIALHNIEEKINFDEDPISFLLVLCDEAQEWGREITFSGQIAVESPCIEMGPFTCENDGCLRFDDKLMIQFDFPKKSILKLTGWRYEQFREAKERAFNRLVLSSKNIRPWKLDYHTALGPKTH